MTRCCCWVGEAGDDPLHAPELRRDTAGTQSIRSGQANVGGSHVTLQGDMKHPQLLWWPGRPLKLAGQESAWKKHFTAYDIFFVSRTL